MKSIGRSDASFEISVQFTGVKTQMESENDGDAYTSLSSTPG
jgi:hypothetical protein